MFLIRTGRHLRKLRTRAHLNGTQAAARISVHANTVYNWEGGVARLSLFEFARYCEALNRKPEEVLSEIILSPGPIALKPPSIFGGTMRKLALLILAFAVSSACFAQTKSHEADLTYSALGCTTAQQCAPIQVYRAQCASATSCPSFTTSPDSFKALPTVSSTTAGYITSASVTATGTTFSVVDTDPALLDNTTYEWVATVAYAVTPSAASGPSNPFQGTTTQAAPLIPSVPVLQPNSKIIK